MKKEESFGNIFEMKIEQPPVKVSKALELIDFTPKFKSFEFSGRADRTPKPRQAKETMKLLEKIQMEVNWRKRTMDISDDEESENVSQTSEYSLIHDTKKPNKRRRDVIFKSILRECRRFFQIQLSELTGFITAKRERNDDYMYRWMEKFNIEILSKKGTFYENFYLACLLYPQDLTRSIDQFILSSDIKIDDVKTQKTKFIKIAKKTHETLYKYSHDKLEFFVKNRELAYLFCYYYENGAGLERCNPKFESEYEFIRQKCMDTLNSS